MKKIKQALQAAADKISVNTASIAKCRKRYAVNHRKALRAHDTQIKAQKQSDAARAAKDTKKSSALDAQAARAAHRAYRAHLRAQWWLAALKKKLQKEHNLEASQAQLKVELETWIKTHGVTINGNQVSGGTPLQRLKACALASAAGCSSGKRPNFYSQSGAWDVDRCITGEHYGERSDCSSWVTSVYKSCGLPDPNGASFSGGYTGTLITHGHIVSVSTIQPGDLVIYGPTSATHHVEMYVGPGVKTIGHGSAPVDPGVIDLFGDGNYHIVRYV